MASADITVTVNAREVEEVKHEIAGLRDQVGILRTTCDCHIATIEAMESEHDEEIGEWQDASGLMAGGDPGGVTPEILREHQGMASDVVLAVKKFLDACGDDNESFMDLKAKLAAYVERWPEQ